MQYLGDYKEDETVYFLWSTNDAVGASVTRTADGTVSVYKDNGVTQSVAGVTDTEDFDGLTGIHACTIDTSADAFYAVGADYAVVLSAATIDGQTVNAVLAHFSIENRFQEVDVVKWLGTAAATPTTAGVPEVDITYIAGAAVAVGSAQLGVNVVQISGDATAADNCEADYDGTGYVGGTIVKQADITKLGGVAQSATDLKDFADAGYDPATNKVEGVKLADIATAVTNDVGITQAGADKVWGTAARALTDKAGFSLSTAGTQAIWDKLTSALTTAGSVGKLLVDDIDATISSRSSHAAADVWSVATRALTDKAGFTISGTKTTLDALNDIAVSDVWDELQSGHTTAGTFGKYLDAEVSGAGSGTPATIADAVWDELKAGHATAGSFGAVLALEATLTDIKGTSFDTTEDSLRIIRQYIDELESGAKPPSKANFTV